MDIVTSFMSLVIISDFGQFFYDAFSSKQNWKEILSSNKYGNMLIIQTTTSKQARHRIEGNQVTLQDHEKAHDKAVREDNEF